MPKDHTTSFISWETEQDLNRSGSRKLCILSVPSRAAHLQSSAVLRISIRKERKKRESPDLHEFIYETTNVITEGTELTQI